MKLINFCKLFILFWLIFVMACKNNNDVVNPQINGQSVDEFDYIGLKIILKSKAGEQFENSAYLPLPLNHGIAISDVNDTLDVLILGQALKDTIAYVLPLAYFELREDGMVRPFILSYPENKKYQSMQIDTYNDFMRQNYPIKVIIDTWFANYKGLAKVRVTNWKDNFFAENLLVENKYWKN
jgi:inorganic pyrophosphatase